MRFHSLLLGIAALGSMASGAAIVAREEKKPAAAEPPSTKYFRKFWSLLLVSWW